MTDLPNPPEFASEPLPVTRLMQQFFGEIVPSEDPLLILGVAPQELTEAGVLLALRRRLDLLNVSVESDSKDADRMRLVLHAAAARLLGVLHRHESSLAVPLSSGEAEAPSQSPQPVPQANADLRATLAAGGGSRAAYERAARMAMSQGLDPSQVLASLQGAEPGTVPPPRPAALAKPAPGARSSPAGASSVDQALEEAALHRREQRSAVRAVLAFSGIGLLGIFTIGAVVVVLALSGKQEAASPNAGGTDTSTPVGVQGGGTSASAEKEVFPTIKPPVVAEKALAPPAPRDRVGDFGDVLRDLDVASHGLEVDPAGAIDRFELAIKEASYRWVEAKPDALIAATNSIVEFMYRGIGQDEILSRALRAINEPGTRDPLAPMADSPRHQNRAAPVAWSAGVLTRLMRERDLPSARREQLRDAFLAIFKGWPGPADSDFRSGAAAALAVLPERLIPPPTGRTEATVKLAAQAWRDWTEALVALDGPKGPLTQRLLLNALERMLITGPDPAQDQVVFDAISVLTTKLAWRQGDESRSALLRWFDLPSVSSADLLAVTSTLARQSGAQGVDYAMVLSVGASSSQRAELRDRYAGVWGLSPAASRDALTTRWIEAARQAAGDQSTPDGLERLARLVHFSRLNLAAWKLRAGDVREVKDLIEAPAPTVTRETDSAQAPLIPIATEASWGVRYVVAGRHIPQRREILAQVTAPPNGFEADLLVSEAVRGSPPQVRAAASTLVDRFSSEPSIVNGLLRLVPFIPPTNDNTELIRRVSQGQVPGPRDPTWRVAVRRALVERLLELAAGKSELGQVDNLARQLAEVYAKFRPRGAGEAAPADDAPPQPAPLIRTKPGAAQPTPEVAASEFAARLTREASALIASGREPLGLLEIQRRSASRQSVAQGQLQKFAALQAEIAETLAFICVAEQPTRETQVRGVLQDLDSQRRLGKHVFEQLEVSERAVTRLWLLRFGEGES